ncbi:Condensin complex subunit 3 like protein [Argiope bruennichi]|uniref:Condensin complex subunit 3 like protein n=1 Tax=Argiope bruennichi TaxID=94029 RepID=A0A8T0DYF6_ARGBR|nr:Condensin complex subunit 3 like protein [Argiope bruennichi]
MTPHVEEEAVDDTKSLYEQLVDIFELCTIEADLSGLHKRLCNIYDSYNGQGFEDFFEHFLKITLSESKRNTDVRKIFSFISELLVNLDNKYKDAKAKESMEEESDDLMHPLLKNVFTLLEQWSRASSYTLDMNTYEALLEVIDARRLDVSCNVRVQAVSLAKFFQDPHTINDPIIAGLCWQMENDPNPLVRKTTVSIVAACEETIIPITKRFLYDKNANVRNAALLHICNRISPRSFTTKQRIMILKQCFSDPSPVVRRNAEQRLIPVWFRAYKDKLTRFFKDLQEGNESLDNIVFIPELLQVLSKCVKIAQIVDEIGLDVDSCLPKSSLSGEQVFLWRHFYQLAHKDNRLSKFIPLPEDLIDFILKYFSNSSIENDQAYSFNELILFLMDLIDTNGVEKCEKVFPVLLDIMKNPFISYEVMPYIVPLYLNYAPKDREIIQCDMLEVIEDLLKMLQFTPDVQAKSIVLKCFAIASQVLIEESVITNKFQNIKDVLINHFLSSEDSEIKIQAITTLSLYCQMDLIEAKLSWPLFAEAVNIGSSPLKNTLLKGAFDILKSHGWQMFVNLTSNGEEFFNEALNNLLLHLEDDEKERNILVQGVLKLFLVHHTFSPIILSQLIALLFHPDEYHSLRKDLEEFFLLYGETKEEAECLSKAFLAVINILFDAKENSPFYKVSIKKVALQLIEYSNGFGNSKNFTLKDNFRDLLALKLTKKFLKRPWRLPASDLYAVCSGNLPKDYDKLLQLKERINLIIESFHSAVFQRKNPCPKRTVKQFSSYLKKIQVALDTAPQIQLDTIPSPIEKRLFTDSYVDSDSQKEINTNSSYSSDQSEALSLTETSSEKISTSSSQCDNHLSDKSLQADETSLMIDEVARANISETCFSTGAPMREASLSKEISTKNKLPLSAKTPSKNNPFPSKDKNPLATKTPAKGRNPLPSKTPGKGKTPLPIKTTEVENPLPCKTPLSKKLSKVKETPLPSKTPKGKTPAKGKTPLQIKTFVDESD